MEKAFKRYTIKAKNLYPVVAVLFLLFLFFDYFLNYFFILKNYRTMRKTSQSEFELPLDCPFTLANILYEMQEKYGEIFDFTILQEIEY